MPCGSNPKVAFPQMFARVVQTVPDVVTSDEGDQILGTRVNCLDFSAGSRIRYVAQDPLNN
jgi:hypothetical protein